MIQVEQLRKSYNGTRGLDAFSLQVKEGELVGLVGPNGAGKTTLIRILSTLLQPGGGRALVAGMDVTARPEEVKRIVGYMPDQPGLYQDMRVREFLEFFAEAFRLTKQQRVNAVDRGLAEAGLERRSEDYVEELSFGMKQRLFLAKTLLHSPRLLLLDEPATGLDPLARIDLRRHLKQLNSQGITILLSSHILTDLEDICTRVALIAEGKNAADSSGRNEIELEKAGPAIQVYVVEVLGDTQRVARTAEQFTGAKVLGVETAAVTVEISGEGREAAQLLKHLVEAGIEVVSFERRVTTLEDRYRKAFGGKTE